MLALASALVLGLVLALVPATLHALRGETAGASPPAPQPVPVAVAAPDEPADSAAISWRRSRSVGLPNAGRLERGVQLPSAGTHFFAWDAILERSPNRGWRRWGSDVLVRKLLQVLAEYGVAHPGAARVAIGDLSRPNGGEFGSRFGGLGHASHQNGLDVDVYYPRVDGLELGPSSVRQIDRPLSRDLVRRFVRAGAKYVFVGPRTRLRGPRRVVQPLVHHDDHMHVRIRPR